jgi:hypothetical protein
MVKFVQGKNTPVIFIIATICRFIRNLVNILSHVIGITLAACLGYKTHLLM